MAMISNIISEFNPKGFNDAAKAAKSLERTFQDVGRKAGLAFAGLAAAGTLAAKAAIEDEAAQATLARTLTNVTGATSEQVKAVEDYITALTLATGVADDELRPSLDRLIRSTKDVAEAERLQALALDISAGTGKSLQQVTEALAKAHDGQFTSLKRLGVAVSDNIIKHKDFNAAAKQLASTFGGQMATNMETSAGKMRILQNSLKEAQETIGYALMPVVKSLSDIFQKMAPWIQQNADKIGTFIIVMGGISAAIWTTIKAWEAYKAISAIILAVTKLMAGAQAAQTVATVAQTAATEVQTGAQLALNAATYAFPATWIIGAIGLVAAALAFLAGKSAATGQTAGKAIGSKYVDGLHWSRTTAINETRKFGDNLRTTFDKTLPPSHFKLIGENVANSVAEGINQRSGFALDVIGRFGMSVDELLTQRWQEYADNQKALADQTAADVASAATAAAEAAKQKISDLVKDLKDKLQTAKDAYFEFRKSVQDTIAGSFDLKGASDAATKSGGSIIDELKKQAEKARGFTDKVNLLLSKGLSLEGIKQVLAAGFEAGGMIADQLLAGGTKAIEEANTIYEAMKKLGWQLGEEAATTFYQTGISNAKKMLEAIENEIKKGGASYKKLMKLMDQLATAAARTIKLSLEGAGVTVTTRSEPGFTIPGYNDITTTEAAVTGTSATGNTTIINVSGALDPESVARQIKTILQRSELRAGAYA